VFYVGHLLRLLRLQPDIQAALRALPPVTSPRMITERRLRSLARLSWNEQLAELDWFLRERKRA